VTILIELTAAIDQFGTLRTFYVSDAPFQTSPTDTPANVAFEPALDNPGDLGVSIYSDGQTSGATKLDLGEIVLKNPDGQFDAWLTYGFDGRPVTIRTGTTGAYPNAFPSVLTGTVDAVEATFDSLTIRIRDRQYVFELPVLTTRFAGSNSLPNGLEGVAGDLKDKPKPKVFGKVFNVSPPCVNTSKLTYQVNDGALQAISAVYDQGAALTPGADYATSTLLQAASPSAGTFITCLAEGYFRLGSSPAGTITADVTQGATAAARTVAQILKALAISAGIPSADVVAAEITALDTANSSVVGIWIDGDRTFRDVMDEVASSIGAYYFIDRVGLFRVGRLTAPSGTSVAEIADFDTLEDTERRVGSDGGRPIWRVTVRHSRLWTVQGSDIASSVTAVRRAELAEEYRAEKAEDAAVKTQFLLANELTIDTCLTAAADAATEAARLLAMLKVRRDVFDVPVPLEAFAEWSGAGMRLGHTVSLTLNRFGMSSGKLFRLIGQKIELGENRAVLSLWG
jgi:hypothetical protein